MPDDFNFSSDIAPLRRQYFPMLTGAQAFDRAQTYDEGVLNPLRDRVEKAQQRLFAARSQDLAYRRQKLAFKEARDQYRMRKSYADTLGPLQEKMNEIDQVITDPFEASQAYSRLAEENLSALRYNPMAADLFKLRTSRIAEQKALAKQEANRISGHRNTLANMYTQTMGRSKLYDDEFLTGLQDGTKTGEDLAAVLSVHHESALLDKARAEQAKAQKAGAVAYQQEFIDDSLKRINTVKFEASEGRDIGETSEDGSSTYHGDLKRADEEAIIHSILRAEGGDFSPEAAAEVTERFGQGHDLVRKARIYFTEIQDQTTVGRDPFMSDEEKEKRAEIADLFGQ